jgi:medium-chain acyl-[acyl-carrier-protein] hydrolase
MNDPTIHRRSYDLRYHELDGSGRLEPTALLKALEDAAFTHCDESGWGVYRLLSEGYGWILLRGGLEMSRYPERREGLVVDTWCSKARTFRGEREFVVRNAAGEELGWARSLWLFYSLEKRRPLPVLPEIVEAWRPEGTVAGPMGLDEVGYPGEEALPGSPSFGVRRADIDQNGHVNNVNYLAWALEALAPEMRDGRFLASIRGQFKREVTYGSIISAALSGSDPLAGLDHGVFARPPAPVGGPAGPAYLAAAARSRWLPLASAASRAA